MITLRSPSEIALMQRAGHILADALDWLPTFVRPGVSTLAIDTEVEALIRLRGATPAFKGYHGFPATVCVSINAEVVHGIPSADRRLREGDIVSVDLGCIVEGYYADCAATLPVGAIPASARALLDVTRESLDLAIDACRAGRRLSDVSHAVQRHVERHGLAVVRAFVGHGIGRALHEPPEVPNFGAPGHGPWLRPGMVLAIEPMVTMGSPEVEVQDDGWTAVTRDGSLAAHFEHTVAITEEGPAVLTRHGGPAGRG
jgi:methionyl aminopeptidase